MNGKEPSNTVLVTGFGPFLQHKINASWETVKELMKLDWESHGVRLVAREIPVCYTYVQREVPLMWKELQPKLVVHTGVMSLAREITMESLATKSGYCKPDIEGNCPSDGCCDGGDEIIQTELNLEEVCKRIKQLPGLSTCPAVSWDAGRYVCEFTYYTSLNVNNKQTVFVHVPEIGKPYSTKEMAECLKYIILYLLEQLNAREDNEIGNRIDTDVQDIKNSD